MIFCDRCGIEVKAKGLCKDCGPGHTAVSENVREEIRMYSALGIPVREIAAHLGVSTRFVYKVAPRRKKVAA